MVADAVPTILLPHRVAVEGGDASALGLMALAVLAVAALAQPLAGALSDRIGRRPIAFAGTTIAVVGLGLLALPGGAFIGATVTLVGVSAAQSAQQALLPDRVGPSWRGRAGGLKGLFDVGGAFLGFVVLAAFLAAGRPDLAIGVLVVALVASVAAGLLLLDRDTDPPTREATQALERGVSSSLYRIVAARFLFLVGIYGVGRFLLLYIADRGGLSPDAAGAQASGLLALLALTTAVASLPGGWLTDRVGRLLPMTAGGALAAAGIGLLAVASTVDAMVLPGLLMALGSALFGAASWAALTDLAPPDRAGRLLGFANLGTVGAAAAAGLLGLLIDAAGFGTALGVAAVASLAGGLLPVVGAGRVHIGQSRMLEEPR